MTRALVDLLATSAIRKNTAYAIQHAVRALVVTFSAGLPVEKREEVIAKFFEAFTADVREHVTAAIREIDEIDHLVREGKITIDIARTKLNSVMEKHAGGDE